MHIYIYSSMHTHICILAYFLVHIHYCFSVSLIRCLLLCFLDSLSDSLLTCFSAFMNCLLNFQCPWFIFLLHCVFASFLVSLLASLIPCLLVCFFIFLSSVTVSFYLPLKYAFCLHSSLFGSLSVCQEKFLSIANVATS